MKKDLQRKRIFQTIMDFSRPQKGRFIGSAIFSTTAVLVGDFFGPLVMAQILDLIQAGNNTMNDFWPLIILFIVIQVVGIICWRSITLLIWQGESLIKRDGFSRVFNNLVNHSIRFHANKFGGSLVSQAGKFSSALENFWDTVIFSVVQLVVGLFGSVIILVFKFWPYAIILTIAIIAYVAITLLMTKRMPEQNIKEAKASSRMSGHLADDVANILTLKAYSAEKRETELAKKKADDWHEANMAVMRDFNRLMIISDIITNGIRIVALVLAVVAKQHNLISIGTILLMVSYTNTVTYRLHELRHIIRSYNRFIGDATEIVEILHTPIEVVDKTNRELDVPKGAIEFKNVTFAHNKGDELFKDFFLKIKPGQKVGLVGHSGSGKSSLASLIMRFYDVNSGQILIDGTDISDVAQASLRQAIAYVPQEPMMFHRTIAENIAFGKPDANQKEIETAAKQACADEFIEKLPRKYETLVGERGVKLSGGQRQRIAIARAIIKGAPILVLDEATSALDSESEKLIQDAMDELMIGRTSVVVAHRLSTIAKLDRIIVLSDGKIVEDGTHEELVKLGGVYARLWEQQSGGFLHELEPEK